MPKGLSASLPDLDSETWIEVKKRPRPSPARPKVLVSQYKSTCVSEYQFHIDKMLKAGKKILKVFNNLSNFLLLEFLQIVLGMEACSPFSKKFFPHINLILILSFLYLCCKTIKINKESKIIFHVFSDVIVLKTRDLILGGFSNPICNSI